MTNLEAILEDLRPYPIRKSLIERKCNKHGLDPKENNSDEKTIAKIVIEVLTQMIALNNVAESGVSLSFNKEGVESNIKFLCDQHGFDSSKYVKKPTITFL